FQRHPRSGQSRRFRCTIGNDRLLHVWLCVRHDGPWGGRWASIRGGSSLFVRRVRLSEGRHVMRLFGRRAGGCLLPAPRTPAPVPRRRKNSAQPRYLGPRACQPKTVSYGHGRLPRYESPRLSGRRGGFLPLSASEAFASRYFSQVPDGGVRADVRPSASLHSSNEQVTPHRQGGGTEQRVFRS